MALARAARLGPEAPAVMETPVARWERGEPLARREREEPLARREQGEPALGVQVGDLPDDALHDTTVVDQRFETMDADAVNAQDTAVLDDSVARPQ